MKDQKFYTVQIKGAGCCDMPAYVQGYEKAVKEFTSFDGYTEEDIYEIEPCEYEGYEIEVEKETHKIEWDVHNGLMEVEEFTGDYDEWKLETIEDIDDLQEITDGYCEVSQEVFDAIDSKYGITKL